jgi:hypothetical protein
MSVDPVEVRLGDSVTIVHADGRIETRGAGRPVSELLRRLRDGQSPAAAVAKDPTVARLVALLDGRIDLIEPISPTHLALDAWSTVRDD